MSAPNPTDLSPSLTISLADVCWSAMMMNRPSESTELREELCKILQCLSGIAAMVPGELIDYQNINLSAEDCRKAEALFSIVIPVFNEEHTIGRVITRVAALPLHKEIILVDDCSTDGSKKILQQLEGLSNFKIILKEKNQGKGAALRDGFRLATGDFIIIQDADLEYDPKDIPALVTPLVLGQADVVYGSRFLGDSDGSSPQAPARVHRWGNVFLSNASNLFTGLGLTDMETCYKAFSRKAIESLEIRQNRFGIEPEITAKLARRGYRFVEVPVTYQGRGYDEGKKIGIKDLFNALYCIVRYGMFD
jgi:glycosyltransferase involved in cell wall biosynthesis